MPWTNTRILICGHSRVAEFFEVEWREELVVVQVHADAQGDGPQVPELAVMEGLSVLARQLDDLVTFFRPPLVVIVQEAFAVVAVDLAVREHGYQGVVIPDWVHGPVHLWIADGDDAVEAAGGALSPLGCGACGGRFEDGSDRLKGLVVIAWNLS